ncbi:Bug family tripartite tricarboxylate transporter substrate binding protein [Salirhabdus salicampi]|uniref:Bug family tripartite tricarboxylate transporter substrate binding protein n=1 Tax=Salirhabdus salicampi TaxID=476102 RepID=UPI0020C4FBA4|nr:tripartite tricarboxylate transporter substrate binding protein [Salirhabdus salicampi]MCP8615660.1 tripartite tricarboxylate transporter substrate binding protein [Salirhabdus salicampi]
MLVLVLALFGCGANETGTETDDSSGPNDDTNTNSNDDTNTNKQEDDYPNKPITIVVPFSAGGSGDTMSRTFAKIAEKYVDVSFVVENKPGGSGAIALNHAKTKPADGYTILYHSSTLPFTMASGKIPFNKDDVQPIATLVSNYQALSVPVDSPFQTLEDFVNYAKDNPGKVKVSGSGINGTNHVFALKVEDSTDIDFNYVSYDGGGDALRAVLGNNVDAITSSGEVVNQAAEEGQVRILAVTSKERVEEHPDVPTFVEKGYTDISDEFIWRAFYAMPGVPEERIDKFNEIIQKVIDDPEWDEYRKNTNQDNYYNDGKTFTEIFNNYYDSAKRLFEKDN